jgi:predicted porin
LISRGMRNVTNSRNLLLLAVLGTAAAWQGTGSAKAADLGGNCCADLEERIAELEATAARKGNRKVTLTVSGWVNEGIFFWDDGVERNVYVGTNSLEQSRFQFVGEASVTSDLSAGYRLELGVQDDPSSGFSQAAPESARSNSLNVRQSHWYLKSKTFGKLAVGLNGMATYHLLDDTDITATRNYEDDEGDAVALGAFQIRVDRNFVGSTKWTDIMGGFNNSTPGQNGRRNVVRYDTPDWMGFTASTAWGEGGVWDAALKYRNKKLGDFDVSTAVGYGLSYEDVAAAAATSQCTKVQFSAKDGCEWWGAGGTILHNPTGLYLHGSYGQQKVNLTGAPAGVDDTSSTWLIQPGIQSSITALGKTVFFGEYRNDDVGVSQKALSSDLRFYSLGVVQQIDKAAMDLYVVYHHSSGDVTGLSGGSAGTVALDDFDMVITGARIQF